jgi:hypothetical protein
MIAGAGGSIGGHLFDFEVLWRCAELGFDGGDIRGEVRKLGHARVPVDHRLSIG